MDERPDVHPDDPDDPDNPDNPDHPDDLDETTAALSDLLRPAPATPRPSPRGSVLRRAWEERFGGWSFGSSHLAVIAVIVLLGLGLAGWSVLRARPVALASGPSPEGPTATRATAPQATAGAATAGTSEPTTGAATASSGQPAGTVPVPSSTPMIKVHVLGAVNDPGVVALAPGSRVQDALERAGGTKKSAHLGDLNLAQPVIDGQQIYIARHGGRSEIRDPASVPAGGSGTGPPGSPAPGSAGTGPYAGASPQVVDLNTATAAELDQLPGVGPVTAQKIIDWRTQHGRFNSVEELQEVDGIGPKTYADLASLVVV